MFERISETLELILFRSYTTHNKHEYQDNHYNRLGVFVFTDLINGFCYLGYFFST